MFYLCNYFAGKIGSCDPLVKILSSCDLFVWTLACDSEQPGNCSFFCIAKVCKDKCCLLPHWWSLPVEVFIFWSHRLAWVVKILTLLVLHQQCGVILVFLCLTDGNFIVEIRFRSNLHANCVFSFLWLRKLVQGRGIFRGNSGPCFAMPSASAAWS